MLYSKLANIYCELEKTSKTLEKTKILADFLKKVSEKELYIVVLLLRGKVAPDYEEFELGIGKKLIIKTIVQSTGASENQVNLAWRKIGDIGELTEKFCKIRKQTTLFSKKLTVDKLYTSLRSLPSITGEGAIDKKLAILKNLLLSAKPSSAKYVTRTILGELRIGVGNGVIRDAIASAFDKEAKEIERAYNVLTDFGEVAKLASENKLASAIVNINKPLRVMLYQKEENISKGFERVGKPAIIEYKYDGFRVVIHKNGEKIKLFTRRLDNITQRFPDIVKIARHHINAKQAILDTEVIGINKKTGKWLPFQAISQRIKRKYNITQMANELPVQINAFDLLYWNGKSLIDESLKARYAKLKKILNEQPGKIELAKQIITDNEKIAEKFYSAALKLGNEGVMMKKISAKYKPGSRVGVGVKIKPTMEPLDLVISGGEWGTGKRAGWISSFVISCRKGDKFLRVGKVGTGFKEKEEMGVSFKKLTKLLKKDIISSEGREIKVKPKIIIEVAYEEIQQSPTYESGYALRFPRLLRMREDKSLSEVDDLNRINRLYKLQRGNR